jgi:uncharacterized protein YecT (DUF1311 family)
MKYFITAMMFFSLGITAGYSQTQMELNENAGKRYEKTDVDLNKVYKQLLTVLSGKDKQLLVNAQRSWISFRDNHCKYEESYYDGGSMQASVWSDCLTELTTERIKQIKDAIEERRNK